VHALIRSAFVEDAGVIAQLATELGYPTTTEQARSRLSVLLARESYFVAVAEVSSRVVGWVAVERRLLLESGERAEIVGLIVSATSRRGGIGGALVQAAEAWARAQGMQALSVRSNVARVEAHPFYEGLGYQRAKTQHAYTKSLTAV
jgi:GNAT superfamily N-acetyltransferase